MKMENVIQLARHIRLLLIDCDGVLTDGGVYYTFDGGQVSEATKVFHIHDGLGLRLAKEAGLKLGIISGRFSPALAARASEVQIDHFHHGISDKLSTYEQITTAESLTDTQIAYIGDDLPDLPPMRRAGLAIAVPDAVVEIRECAHFITSKPGGNGAVRESIELILKAQGLWDSAIKRYIS